MAQNLPSKSRFATAFETAISVAILVGFIFLGFMYYSCHSEKKAPYLPNHSILKIYRACNE